MFDSELSTQRGLNPRPSPATIDYRSCVGEFLRELRGNLSQRDLSQLLGFSFNQVGKWESGATHFKWSDLFLLCEALDRPFEQYFREQFWSFSGNFNPTAAVEEILAQLKELGLSRTLKSSEVLKQRRRFKRWVSAEQEPDLAEVFAILDRVPSMLISFLSYFVDCEKMPSLAKPYEQFKQGMDLVHREPLCVFVNAALQLRSYRLLDRHSDEILASSLGCHQEDIHRLINVMLVHGLIAFDGKKFNPGAFDFSFSAARKKKLRGLTKFATQMAADRYPPEPMKKISPSISSVRVNALSREAAEKIMALVSSFHHQVSQVVEEDQDRDKEAVQVILIHSFSTE